MSLLDTVEPDWYGNANSIGEKQTALVSRFKCRGSLGLYSRETVKRLLAEHRKQVLLEMIADAESHYVPVITVDELRRMGEGDKGE